MGKASRQRTAKFLAEHPTCCLCGGTNPATTIEHAPPKIMFTGSHRPKGLEVPSCARCNNGSSSQDQVAAMFSFIQSPVLFDGLAEETPEAKAMRKALKGVSNNQSDLAKSFKPAGKELVRINGVIRVLDKIQLPDELFETYLEPWAVKQTLALWYDQTGTIASDKAKILVRWTTLHEMSASPELVQLAGQIPDVAELAQGKWNTADQFFARHAINPEDRIGMFFFAYQSGVSFFATFVDNPNVNIDDFMSSTKQFGAYQTSLADGIYRVVKDE